MLLTAGVITLLIFLVFAFNLNSDWVHHVDKWGKNTFEGNSILEPFHYIGEPIFVVIVAIVLLLFLWFRAQNFRAMIFTLITIAGGNVVNMVVKSIVERPRPERANQLTSYSFPSGHSMTGILYLLTLAYLLTEFRSKTQKIWAFTIAGILTICIGLSRVAGTRHFMSDVISGWALGFTVFVIAVLWYGARKRAFKKA